MNTKEQKEKFKYLVILSKHDLAKSQTCETCETCETWNIAVILESAQKIFSLLWNNSHWMQESGADWQRSSWNCGCRMLALSFPVLCSIPFQCSALFLSNALAISGHVIGNAYKASYHASKSLSLSKNMHTLETFGFGATGDLGLWHDHRLLLAGNSTHSVEGFSSTATVIMLTVISAPSVFFDQCCARHNNCGSHVTVLK